MNATVRVIYAADRTTSQIDNVPRSATIGAVKEAIAALNHLRISHSGMIRLVQHGQILDDSEILSSLSFVDGSRLDLYATGIPTRVHTSPTAVVDLPKRKSFAERHSFCLWLIFINVILPSFLYLLV
jgi:hypothetical protein